MLNENNRIIPRLSRIPNKKKVAAISAVFIIISFLAHSAFSEEVDKKYTKAWQHVAAKHLFDMPLHQEEALVWHLDYNGFAVRLPDCLMIFDYDNETPAPQWDMKPEFGIIESLFTGVVNLEEIKNERVVFLFSHDHPFDKIMKLLPWKDTIKEVLFLMTPETYRTHEKEITELQEEEKSDLGKKPIDSVIKIVEPNHVYTIYGNRIRVREQKAVLDVNKKIMYPGVEFIVDTENNLTLYHSGSLICRHCFYLGDIVDKYKRATDSSLKDKTPHVIDAHTEKMLIVNGRTVAAGSKDEVDEAAKKPAGAVRMALAVYSDPQPIIGYMLMYVSAAPRPMGRIGSILTFTFLDNATYVDYAWQKAREKDHFFMMDKFLADRNPQFDAKLSDELDLEWEMNEIKEYFGQMEGSADQVTNLKDAAIRRHTYYVTKVHEYHNLGIYDEDLDVKLKYRLLGGEIFEISCNTPSTKRGETYYFTTREDWPNTPAGHLTEYFRGYWTSAGYPLFWDGSILTSVYEECDGR